MNGKKPRVLIIGTGGTISAKAVDGKFKCGEIPQEQIVKLIPGIRENFEIRGLNLFRVDSSDIKPEHWQTIANTIYYNMKGFDGVVVAHGTNTMAYTASAIAFLLQGQGTPIVFTGAIVDPNQLNSDARTNLREAIMVAGTSPIAETVVVMNSKIIRAVRARKANASNFDSFTSIGRPPVGRVERFIELFGKYGKRDSKAKPSQPKNFETRVAIFKLHPGFDASLMTSAIEMGIKGIVIEAYGVGNLPTIYEPISEAIRYANRKGVPIVITSQCDLGTYWSYIYKAEIGDRFKGLKLIPAYDMTTEAAFAKLMWVLGQTKGYAKVKKMMQKDYIGEISEEKIRQSMKAKVK